MDPSIGGPLVQKLSGKKNLSNSTLYLLIYNDFNALSDLINILPSFTYTFTL